MKGYKWIFIALLLLQNSLAAPASRPSDRAAKVRIVLAGDSTVTEKAGWGKAVEKMLSDRAECVNFSRGGAEL
jgi:hypothetical protein